LLQHKAKLQLSAAAAGVSVDAFAPALHALMMPRQIWWWGAAGYGTTMPSRKC
jgi:hypothetical protein